MRHVPRNGAVAVLTVADLAQNAQQRPRPAIVKNAQQRPPVLVTNAQQRQRPQASVRGDFAVAGRAWSDEAWRAIQIAVHHVFNEAARRNSGAADAAAHARLAVDVTRAMDTAASEVCRLASAFHCTTLPEERNMTLWENYLASNVGRRLAEHGLWPEPLNAAPDSRADAVLAAPAPWIESMEQARQTMLQAGMGESRGLPPGLGTLKQPWRFFTDPAVLTLPPPLDRGVLPAGPHGLCGFVPCRTCIDVAMRASLRFLARADLGARGVFRVDFYSQPPMHMVISGAPLPLANCAGDALGARPLCKVSTNFWRWDGERTPSPALRVKEMHQCFSTDPELPARPVYMVWQADGRGKQHVVVRVPFFFDIPANGGGSSRVVHDILLCDCCGSVQLLVAQLRHAARGQDPAVGDLAGFLSVLLQSYHHCHHTLRVQAQLLDEDPLLKTELEMVRCIARRSPCCASEGTCDRSHTSIFMLPLRLAARGEVEIAASYALFGVTVGEVFTLVCRDATDGCAVLAPVHHKPGQVRCQNVHDCSAGIQCVHETNFSAYAAASGFSFLDLKRAQGALLGSGVGGAAPRGAAPPPAVPVQAVSTTLIAPKLHDGVVERLKSLEAALCRLTTESTVEDVHGASFEIIDRTVHLWDIRCSVAGCEELLTVDRTSPTSAILQTRSGFYVFTGVFYSINKGVYFYDFGLFPLQRPIYISFRYDAAAAHTLRFIIMANACCTAGSFTTVSPAACSILTTAKLWHSIF